MHVNYTFPLAAICSTSKDFGFAWAELDFLYVKMTSWFDSQNEGDRIFTFWGASLILSQVLCVHSCKSKYFLIMCQQLWEGHMCKAGSDD